MDDIASFMISSFMVTARVLADSFMKMEKAEFDSAYQDILVRGEAFSREDDAGFVAKLEEMDALRYASYVNAFVEAYGKLKKAKPSDGRLTMSLALAETVALWQTICDFRTLHE